MTTFNMMTNLSSASKTDFVSTDTAELASHMNHCASSRGRFFALNTALQCAHSVLCTRIVTVGALVVVASVFLGLASVA